MATKLFSANVFECSIVKIRHSKAQKFDFGFEYILVFADTDFFF